MDAATARAETVILGLRLSAGIEAAMVDDPEVAAALDWAREHGLVEEVAARTRLTQRGRLLANEVFARLLPGPDGQRAGRSPAAGGVCA